MLRQVGEGFNTLIASPETSHSHCRISSSHLLYMSHSHVSRSCPPSLLHLLAPRYRKPACATLAASLSMAHCLVQLNSYTISALSLAHHSPTSSSRPPPARGWAAVTWKCHSALQAWTPGVPWSVTCVTWALLGAGVTWLFYYGVERIGSSGDLFALA